jgi:hypothetical protein
VAPELLEVKWETVDLKENALGLQAQNLYLVNYLNKLEFLLQETVNERRRDKKHRLKQLGVIISTIKERGHLAN